MPVLGVFSPLPITLLRKRELFALLNLCCGCLRSVPLHQGAVDWSAFCDYHARIQRGWGQGIRTLLLQNPLKIGFLSNTCKGPQENHTATKPVLIVGQPSASQRNAIRWRADDGPHLVVFGNPLSSYQKKNLVRFGHL